MSGDTRGIHLAMTVLAYSQLCAVVAGPSSWRTCLVKTKHDPCHDWSMGWEWADREKHVVTKYQECHIHNRASKQQWTCSFSDLSAIILWRFRSTDIRVWKETSTLLITRLERIGARCSQWQSYTYLQTCTWSLSRINALLLLPVYLSVRVLTKGSLI